jgi:ribosomal protein S18 acetylase RimI-like enzyme
VILNAGAITVRSALPSDAAAIATIHAESWRTAYRGILRDEFLDGPVFDDRHRVWENRLSTAPPHQYVAMIEEGVEPKGFVCVFLDADPEWGALLDNLHVRASARGMGLGRRLMAAGAGWVLQHKLNSPLHLWVYEQNVAARRFYERLGGVVTTSRLHSAPDGSQAPAIRYVWRDLVRLT